MTGPHLPLSLPPQVASRGIVPVKGKGEMETFWLLPPDEEGGYPDINPTGKHAQSSASASGSNRSPRAWSSFTLGAKGGSGSIGSPSIAPLSSSPVQFSHLAMSDVVGMTGGQRSASLGSASLDVGVSPESFLSRRGASRSVSHPDIGLGSRSLGTGAGLGLHPDRSPF